MLDDIKCWYDPKGDEKNKAGRLICENKRGERRTMYWYAEVQGAPKPSKPFFKSFVRDCKAAFGRIPEENKVVEKKERWQGFNEGFYEKKYLKRLAEDDNA